MLIDVEYISRTRVILNVVDTDIDGQILTYHYYPQNTADDKYKVPVTVQIWQCFLRDNERDKERHWKSLANHVKSLCKA